ncbi:WXG100-like domain-containing protein [Nocardioides campestrisoli]|uniref:WXG100-like domain-containing protein n=1 Tax=Nocardioides campestrisoli TaxID=2736757 RepID=UPI001C637B1F|nr:hypothetical protein [Nocardioides campestrisoli]
MTRVDPDQVLKAADCFADANGAAATAYGTLKSWISSSANMAGDDQTSDDFAREYDTAARDAMTAAAEMVGALAGMARLVYLTGGNHTNANLASVYSANPLELNSCVSPETTVTVAPYHPPSAAGGDDPDTPPLWDKVTDYLEGYTWPGADADTLRSVGDAWAKFRSALLDTVLPHVDSAVAHLRAQDSPDLDVALGVISDLRLEIDELGHHTDRLGEACRDYAQQVEDVRGTVKSILEDLAVEVGLTAVVAGGLAFFTAGASAAGGGAIAGWRLAAAGRKVVQAFVAMKAAVRLGAVAKISTAGRKLPVLSQRFRRVSEAASSAKHARYTDQLRAAMGKPATKDPKLNRIMDELYRDNAKMGSGSTAAAVRSEIATGKPTNGAWHSQKARNRIAQLEKWLRTNPTATPGDRAAAENVIRDMQNALDGN